MRLNAGLTAEEIAASLRREAIDSYGAERAEELDGQLRQHAQWLARIAAAPLELDEEAPDLSGLEERT